MYVLLLGLEHLQSGIALEATEAEQSIRFDKDGPTTFIASSDAPFSASWRSGCLVLNIDAYRNADYKAPAEIPFEGIRELVESNARLQRPSAEQKPVDEEEVEDEVEAEPEPDGHCCDNCAVAMANDDYSGMTDAEAAATRDGLKSLGWPVIGDEVGFMHERCDICDGLAGARHGFNLPAHAGRVAS